MSCSQTTTTRQPISSNAGAMAAGYAMESTHAFAADAICRRPLLRPASQEDGRRAAIRHFLNTHGQLLQSSPEAGAGLGFFDQARHAGSALVSEGARQLSLLASSAKTLAASVDATLQFGAVAAASATPPQACAADGTCADKPDSASQLAESMREMVSGSGSKGLHDASPLLRAVSSNDAAAVERLLAAGTDVNHIDRTGISPLHKAVVDRNLPMVERLLLAGASTRQSSDGITSLALAVNLGDVDIAKALLKAGADVNGRTVKDYTPMLMAAAEGDLNMIHALVEAGADVNLVDHLGQSALSIAILKGNLRVVHTLLRFGADPNAQNLAGISVLFQALTQGNPDAAKALLANKANPNKPGSNGVTALEYVVNMGNVDLVESLLNAGAHVEEGRGITPLGMAVGKGNSEIVDLLLRGGADPDRVMDDGGTALILAMMNKNMHLCDKLLQAGASVGPLPGLQVAAFDLAVSSLRAGSGKLEILRLMLKYHGQSAYIKSQIMKVLVFAVLDSDLSTMALLLDHMNSSDKTAKNLMTYLQHAVRAGNVAMTSLLLRYDAYQPEYHILVPTLLDEAIRRGEEQIAELLRSHGATRSWLATKLSA